MAETRFDSLVKKLLELDKASKKIAVSFAKINKELQTTTSLEGKIKLDKKLNTEAAKLVKTQKQLNTARKQASKINERAVKEADKETQAFDRKLQKLKAVEALEKKEIKTKARLSAEAEKYRQIEVKSIADLKKKIKGQKIYVESLDRTSKGYRRATKELKKNEQALKRHNKQVGKGSKFFKNLIGKAAAFVGIYGVIRALSAATKIFKNFEKASKRLQAITGATAKELKVLTEQAKRLGSTTAFTASQVLELQTELAKLGFTTQQIEASTEGILALAAATGTDLAESATLAGAAVRIFGLTAEETARVADVLALSTSKSALDMTKLATALPIVGTTAKQAGLSIEETTALLGVLSDRGIDASTAGTGLRNIFLELAKQGLTFNEAMEKINTSSDKSATAMQLFGKRSATAAVILSETGDATADLTEELNNAKGAAQEMADVMLDNLSGDITKAKSAWEGFILSIEDGDGIISSALRNIITAVSNLLRELTELNKFGKVINKNAAEGAEKEIERFKKQIEFSSESIKKQRLKLFLLKIEGDLINANKELDEERIGGTVKRFKEIKATIQLLEREKALLIDLGKSGFFEGQTIAAEINTEAINDNTDAVEKNIKAKKGLSEAELREGYGIEGRKKIALGGVLPGAKDDLLNKEIIEVFNGIKTTYNEENSKLQNYFTRLRYGEGTLLERIFGGGETGKAVIGTIIDTYQKAINFIGETVANELARLDTLINRQTEAIEGTKNQLDAEKDRLNELKIAGAAYDLTEQNRLQNKLTREETIRNKTLAAEKKLREKQKRIAIAQANIDIASSILAIWAGPGGYILKIIQTAAFAILGGIQIANIKNQKFAEGGWVKGPSHDKGGVDITREAEGGEFIVRKKYAPESSTLLNMINKGVLNDSNLQKGHLGVGQTAVYDFSKTNKYLEKIETNTSQTKGFKPDGSLAWEMKNRTKLIY